MRTQADVSKITETADGVQIELKSGERITSRVCLAGFSPEMLNKVANMPSLPFINSLPSFVQRNADS